MCIGDRGTRHGQGVVLSASAVAGVVEAVGYEEVSKVFGPADRAGVDVHGEIGSEPRLRLAASEEAEAPGADALERSRELHRFDRRRLTPVVGNRAGACRQNQNRPADEQPLTSHLSIIGVAELTPVSRFVTDSGLLISSQFW